MCFIQKDYHEKHIIKDNFIFKCKSIEEKNSIKWSVWKHEAALIKSLHNVNAENITQSYICKCYIHFKYVNAVLLEPGK